MIPDQYWQVFRRWYWLIGICVVTGGGAAYVVLPDVLASSASYDSSATVAVSHYVSPTRIVTTGEADTDDGVVADYTEALAAYARTPQFTASVQEQLTEQGVALHYQTIADSLVITATPELFRIDVHGTGGAGETTEALVTAAAAVLIQRAEDEEARVAFGLVATIDDQRDALVARLDDLAEQRQALLATEIAAAGPPLADRPEVGRLVETVPLLGAGGASIVQEMTELLSDIALIVGNPDLVAVDVEIATAEQSLAELTTRRERLLSNRTFSAPVALLNPTETVETEAAPLKTRDTVLLGGALGLITGWMLANLGERIRRRAPDAPESPALRVVPEPEGDARLQMLMERSAALEQRARALALSVNGADGNAQEVVASRRS